MGWQDRRKNYENFMPEKKRLKVLFLPAWYPSKKNPVAGIFIKEHAKAVSLYNDVVVLYSEGYDEKFKKIWEIVSDKKEDGIRTIRIKHRKSPIPKTTYFIYLWSIKQAFKKLLKEDWKPDIIHAHIYSAGVVAVILGKRYKIPIVITEHWSGFPLHKLSLIERIRARFAINRANIILPVSKNLEESIKSYEIKNQFEVLPNVVDTKLFHQSLNRKSNNKKKILFVGLITPIKGLFYLIKALSQVRQKRQDFVLDIVGDGPNRQEYEELTKKLEIQNLVKFHGLKSKKEVAEFMRNCDFFIQPSLYGTFGVVYIEAIACGKPVVATNLPVLQELIDKERGILVPTRNVDVLARAIDYMLDHYKDYSPDRISKYVRDNFSYKKVGEKLDKIYRRLI